MNRRGTTFCKRGYTLIELMAVVVIMALAAGFLLPNVAATSDAARCRAIAAQLQDLDRKARLLARSEGRVEFKFDPQAQMFVLTATDSNQQLAALAIERGTIIVLTTEHAAASVLFDRAGRSEDYAMVIQRESNRSAFYVAGATGLMREGRP